jgi:aryl-alcohol dehydrogenase-like predicted oxidoreductase
MTLPTRQLGRTGEQVTVLGYGAMELRGHPRGPAIDDGDAGRLLHAVLDGGINLIDTSIDYGRSEELIGLHLSARRDEFFLASKCGCLLDPPPGGTPPFAHDYHAENVRAGAEQSLRRLRSTRSAAGAHVPQSLATGDRRHGGRNDSPARRGQGPLSRYVRHPAAPARPHRHGRLRRLSDPVLRRPARARGPHRRRSGGGRRHPHPGRRRPRCPAADKAWRSRLSGLPEGEGQRRWDSSGVGALLAEMDPFEFVLRFTFSHPGLSSTIVGTANPEHLRANLVIAERGPLPADLYEEAKRQLPEP